MMLAGPALTTSYNYWLVGTSVLIAILASYAALNLSGRVSSTVGGIRLLWLTCGAMAMGIGIWSMHYIGMLALRLPVRVEYDWPTVLVSLLAAVLASAVALSVASRPRMGLGRALTGSLFMGTGIAAMHYIGMAAMRMPAMCRYSPGIVALSVVLAVVISFAALYLTFEFREEQAFGNWKRMLAALVMGGAIPVMHYTGMAAVTYVGEPMENGGLANAVGISSLGIAGIVIVTLTVLGIVLATSVADRRFSAQAMELASSEQRYRLIVETAFDAFVGIDTQGKVADWNAQAETLFGWKRSEVTGKLFSELIEFGEIGDPRDVRAYLDSVIKMFSRGHIETTARNRDGREFPVEMAISAFDFGKAAHFAAFLHDVTERKKAEEEREKARAEAEAASRAKDEFLANMSHEIRTPLNGIIGMTDLALDTPHTEELHDYLETVKFSADSLLTIINDILDFSKIEAGKMDLELIDFNLRENLELTLKTLAPRVGKKGLELLLDISPAVPEFVCGDPSRLRQIILNLTGNSIKFTERGEVGLAVQCEAMEPDHCVLHFTVSDTGIGIPPDKHKTIFEAFSQADSSTTRRYGGTGLGLTISSRLVEMMGGKIWVESEVARGTQFHFTVQMAAAKLRAADTSLAVSTEKLKGLRALIVDDNAANRRILRTLLEKWEMTCTTAEGGEQALLEISAAQRSGAPFSLILTDLMMPDMDGFQFVEQMRKIEEDAAATTLILTSAGHRGDGRKSRMLGVAGYLLKPVRKTEMLEAICRTLGHSRKDRERPLITRYSVLGAGEPTTSLDILLAEDNVVNQKLAMRLLEKRGHRVSLAGNGREALELFEHKAFDLILMDVQMPEMDGFQALAEIRKVEEKRGNRVRTPVIALTAHALVGDRNRCIAAGMDGYLAKPLHAADLDEVLRKFSAPRTEISSPVEEPLHSK